MRERRPWDGRWLVLTVGVPESQRQLRHRLRTRLTWLGAGSPAPGLWIVTDAAKEPEVRAVVAELGLADRAFAWTGHATGIGDPARLIKEAWDLDDVEDRYLAFIDRFQGMRAATDREAFVQQVLLIQEWRRFPFLDPDLPVELLDHDWPGPTAAATFHSIRTRAGTAARRPPGGRSPRPPARSLSGGSWFRGSGLAALTSTTDIVRWLRCEERQR